MNKSYSVHAELPETTVWVNPIVFYNMDENRKDDGFVKSKIFGITCLKGNVPTFEILTDDGYVFSEIPPHMISLVNPEENNDIVLSIESLVYNNCLSKEFTLTEFKSLKNRQANVFIKSADYDRGGFFMSGNYWFSLDFHEDNNWFHCLKLENGQLAFIPSHKIIFKSGVDLLNHSFPLYQKLRKSFSV